jgi:hypothetical protein
LNERWARSVTGLSSNALVNRLKSLGEARGWCCKPRASQRMAGVNLPRIPAVSMGQCNNTGLKFTSGGFKAQSFSRALIQLQGNFVEISLRIA